MECAISLGFKTDLHEKYKVGVFQGPISQASMKQIIGTIHSLSILHMFGQPISFKASVKTCLPRVTKPYTNGDMTIAYIVVCDEYLI